MGRDDVAIRGDGLLAHFTRHRKTEYKIFYGDFLKMNIQHRTSNKIISQQHGCLLWYLEDVQRYLRFSLDIRAALLLSHKPVSSFLLLEIRCWTFDVRCSFVFGHREYDMVVSLRLEYFTEVRVGKGFVENLDLLFQFSLVLERHTKFQGCSLEVLRGEQADPAAQIKLPQVMLE